MQNKAIFLLFKKISGLIFCAALAALPSALIAQTCAIPGKDGPATITTAVNTYYGGSGSPTAGSTSLTLGTLDARAGLGTTAVAAGDLILIIQMQDSSGALEGNYEYARVAAAAGSAITLVSGLSNSYAQSFSATTLQTFQIIRVPQYSSATLSGTINVPAWTINTTSGQGTGGVFAIDVAGALNIAAGATVNANGKGFRGAFGIQGAGNRAGGLFTDANYTPNLAAMNGSLKGEGTNGVPNQLFEGTATPVTYTSGLYSVGTAGQAANGNAGGGANDGLPATGINQYNSGGGGGGNQGAGGKGGFSWSQINDAGGRGGNAVANSAAKLYLGGGGGAGSTNNNGGANTVTTYPPTAVVTPGKTTTFSGASGPVSSSGAAGGGIILVRAGNVSAGAGASLQANGYASYSTNGTGSSDSAGGGGAGGSILIQAATGTGSIAVSAVGGKGGDSNYWNHGPGGGGGGGWVGSSGVTVTGSVAGGANGIDADNGAAPNNVADAYNSVPGTIGSLATTATNPAGGATPASCNPNLTVTKGTTTSVVTTATGATATYSITVANAATAGAAQNLEIIDNGLPTGWTLAAAPAITYAYTPAPPPAANNFASGAEATVNAATYALRANAAAPGTVPAAASNGPLNWNTFFVAPGGSVVITYTVNIPDTAAVGTYHNDAGVRFLDPTRSTAGRKVSPLTNNTANRAGTSYGNTTFETGAVANVPGTNYSGLVAGAAGEDVRLAPDLSLTKTNSNATPANGAAFNYTLTARNNGRQIRDLTFAADQATTATAASLGPVLTNVITDTLPTGIVLNGTPTGTNWTCTGVSGDASFTCTYTGAYPWAAATNLTGAITVPVRTTNAACGAARVNTAVLGNAQAAEASTTNNTATDAPGVTPSCAASLAITKTDNRSTVQSGDTVTYVVTLTNNGPSSADGTTLSDPAVATLTKTAVSCVYTNGAAGPATPTPTQIEAGIIITSLPNTGVATCSITATVN